MITNNSPESYNEFLQNYFFNLGKYFFGIFQEGHFWNHACKKQSSIFHKHELSIFISTIR